MKFTKINLFKIIFFGLFILSSTETIADIKYKNYSKYTNIKTIQLHRNGWPLETPVIELHKNFKLLLNFDDIENTNSDFSYKIIHCNYDWTKSDLSEMEYLEGINETDINISTPSFHTFYNYTNYQSLIPSEDLKITKSGNYIIKVYKDYDEDDVVFTRKFYVFEYKSEIITKIRRARQSEYSDTKHQVELEIKFNNNIENLSPESLHIFVCQNNNTTFGKYYKHPYIKGETYQYNSIDDILFPAGNEFKYADLKDTNYKNLHVYKIDYDNRYYHYYLNIDKDRSYKEYYTNTDLNGNYFITNERADDPNTESDYVYLHNTLKIPLLEKDQKVYLFGRLTDWQIDEDFALNYNHQTDNYELTTLVKQGAYNYKYVLQSNGKIDLNYFSGNYYQTENDYIVFVYLKSIDDRYDRLIGYSKKNSVNTLN